MFKMGVALEEEPSDSQVHAEQWHLGIDTSQLRWESYVKAGYYVCLLCFCHFYVIECPLGRTESLLSKKIKWATCSG
jgi:hypothetical protein